MKSTVKDINTTAGSSGPRSFVRVGSLTFFTGTTTEYGTELWYTDGTSAGTNIVKDIIAGSQSGVPRNLVSFRNKLHFSAIDYNRREKLWESDGTTSQIIIKGL